MIAKIALLSNEVINQIAAGEVIENPASVVKELVDNSIDAGSSHIIVKIQAGGQQMILVEDNGCGMGKEDLELCLLRHATSKLKEVADLDVLNTMGFRGEALAAIASISKLEICTSTGSEGMRLSSSDGKIEVASCARNRGTSIEVSSLFFNAPARRKFQKSTQACTSHIVRVMQQLALAHPEISFSLFSNGQILLETPACSGKERIAAVLGTKFFEEGNWFDANGVRGFLGAVTDARATRSSQYFFINRRPIFSPLLSKAAKEGYGTRLTEGTHPAVVLFLELDPTDFDVNVHPQKREVRFKEDGILFRKIRDAVQKAHLPGAVEQIWPETVFSSPSPFSLREEPFFNPPIESQRFIWDELPQGKALTVLGSFLLAEKNGELLLIDLQGALEEKALQSKERQQLLLPVMISLSVEEEARTDELFCYCREVGCEARAMGSRQICLDEIPSWLDLADAQSFFTTLKESFKKGVPAIDILKNFIRTKSSRFTLQEAELLWKKNQGIREVSIHPVDLERIIARK